MSRARQDRLFLFATIRPKPQHIEDVLGALHDLIPPTLAEPGCHLFSAFRNREDPSVVHLYEAFDDEDALERHYAAGYTQAVFHQYQKWLSAPVEIVRLQASSHLSADQYS